MDIKNLAQTIKEAFAIARSGRPGPVLIDIPKDVQAEEYDFIYPEEPVKLPGKNPLDKEIDKKSLGDAADLLLMQRGLLF